MIMAIWFTASFAFSGDEVSPLKGEYKEIKTTRESKAIKTFLEGTDEQKEKLASRIQEHPNRYAPAVFFHLSVYLYVQDEVDDALFWLYCARIRTYFDIQRCTDRSVEGAGEILNNLVPALLKLEQFQDLENSKQIMKNAVQWDRETPHDYDARWIALHGIRAFQPEPAPGTAEPLTIPEDQWETLAEKHRDEYLTQWLADLSSITEEQLTQIQEKYDELLAAEESREMADEQATEE
jgi:hypothetical protein